MFLKYIGLADDHIEKLSLYYLVWSEVNSPEWLLEGVLNLHRKLNDKYSSNEMDDLEYLDKSFDALGRILSNSFVFLKMLHDEVEITDALARDIRKFLSNLSKIHNRYAAIWSQTKSKGWASYRGKQYSAALKDFLASAESGDRQVYPILGAMYHDGEGTKIDYSEALRWWVKGSLLGEPNCMVMIGKIHQKKCVKHASGDLYNVYTYAGSSPHLKDSFKIFAENVSASDCLDKLTAMQQRDLG